MLILLSGTGLMLLAGCISCSLFHPGGSLRKNRFPPVIIEDAYPDKAFYRLGEEAVVVVRIQNSGDFAGTLVVRLTHLAAEIGKIALPVRISGEGIHELRVPLDLPEDDFRGYGVDIELKDASGKSMGQASTALDVLSDWTQAPRYGFLADFSADEPDTEARVRQLSKYHITVVQFYDWMYRHYQLLPTQDKFTDGMGRKLSLNTVLEKIDLCHRRNMAALAYGAVYGAEPEFFKEHPDLALYNAKGDPESIENLFYIMDIRRESPWHDLIISEYQKAVTELSFDGIHMDQYGFPRMAFVGGADGPRVFLDNHFGPLIDAAAEALKAKKPSARVIFNCVNNWPTDKVAARDQAAVYIEVWSPHNSYSDLRKLILRAKEACAGKKQVILAAYMTPLGRANADKISEAEAATLFTTAAIFACGGFHLLMGEKDGALCGPYYPEFAALRPQFAEIMRKYYDFFVRYEEWLVEFGLQDVSESALSPEGFLSLDGCKYGSIGRAGEVWTLVHEGDDFLTINLINLTGHRSDYWNFPQPMPPSLKDIAVELDFQVKKAYLSSPDFNFGRAEDLRLDFSTGKTRFRVPKLEYWNLIIVQR